MVLYVAGVTTHGNEVWCYMCAIVHASMAEDMVEEQSLENNLAIKLSPDVPPGI